ncbi:MAG: DUF6283 family protein [Waterburya sp.]|jgi:Family of unknown function (DUF6283)
MTAQNWSLKYPVQCAKCPWRVEVDPFEIPRGYDPQKHCDLESTIATDLSIPETLRIMACHDYHEEPCIGWLHNQLINNNLRLRLSMLTCDNAMDYKVIGKQHPTFKDTLPKK